MKMRINILEEDREKTKAEFEKQKRLYKKWLEEKGITGLKY